MNKITVNYNGKYWKTVKLKSNYNPIKRRDYYRKSKMNWASRWYYYTALPAIKLFLQRVIIVTIAVTFVTGIYLSVIEAYFPPVDYISEKVGQAFNRVILMDIPITEQTMPTVLKRIAYCESGGKQEVEHINPTDTGKYGINEYYWGDKARELGYNLDTEKGNTKMALWIFNQRGTVDWYLSEHCWNK